MSGQLRPRRSAISLASGITLLLLASLLTVEPVVAHSFKKTDGNDSPGRLDIRSAAVAHKGTSVIHPVQTFEGWTPQSLGQDSLLVVLVDRNFDQDFELCAVIYFASGRLHATLTNCARTVMRALPISKPSASAVRVSIPTAQVGAAYRWVVFSFWTAPGACANECFDAAPNRPPPIVHDLTPPTISMSTAALRVWRVDTDANFEFPFSVSDARTGVMSWSVQRRVLFGSTWTTKATGSGGGSKSPVITGEVPGRYEYRVVAEDKQGNRATGPTRRIYIPTDDADLTALFSDPPTLQQDVTAFAGSYSQMSTGTFTYTRTPGANCRFELIGPGTGDWSVQVTPTGGSTTTLADEDFLDEPRSTLYSDASCATSYTVTWVSGTFGLDAVFG